MKVLQQELNARLGVVSIVRRGRLRWYGHLERKSSNDWVSACRDYEVIVQKSRGRSRKTWAECVKHDLQSLGLRAERAQDRNECGSLFRGIRPTLASMKNWH